MPETYVLIDEFRRNMAIAAVVRARIGMAVTIDRPPRTSDQNRRLWSMLSAIAKSGMTFDGMPMDAEDWKDLLGSAWLKTKGRETGQVRKGLEGEAVVIGGRFRSSKLNTEEFAEFCDSVLAFIDDHGVPWAEREEPPPPKEAQ